MIGLVLQGGGALGAFEWGVIERLLEKGIVPDVVSGVSIGAINAAVLAGSKDPDPRVELRALWKDLTTPTWPAPLDGANAELSAFGNPGMYTQRADYWDLPRWKNLYDTKPLYGTLGTHVDFTRLQPEAVRAPKGTRAPRLILTAANLDSGELDSFDSRTMRLSAEHVVASCSLPPVFPMTQARGPGGDAWFWDGGVVDNTPLSGVIHALEESGDAKRTLYVVNLFPLREPLPRNIPEVIYRMQTLALSNRMQKDLHRAERSTKIIQMVAELDRLMEQHQELKSLRDHEGYKAVKRRKEIEIIRITNRDVTGPTDFSATAIEHRWSHGYAAARARIP
jgi:predicted acylesterase/phospholipase RssA